jgi:hypothetical protein
MKVVRLIVLMLMAMGNIAYCVAEDTVAFRLLSISESEKLILVSRISDKTKFLLDVAAAKIVVDGKPAEIGELKSFTLIKLKWKEREEKRNGVSIDGTVSEIEVSSPTSQTSG